MATPSTESGIYPTGRAVGHSLKWKVWRATFGIVLLLVLAEGVRGYYQARTEIEASSQRELLHIVKTLAVGIDPEAVRQARSVPPTVALGLDETALATAKAARDMDRVHPPAAAAPPAVRRLYAQLHAAKEANGLGSPIYLMYPTAYFGPEQWRAALAHFEDPDYWERVGWDPLPEPPATFDPATMRRRGGVVEERVSTVKEHGVMFGVSTDMLDYGNYFGTDPAVLRAFLTHEAQTKPLYTDAEGTWVSALVPLLAPPGDEGPRDGAAPRGGAERGASGEVLAILQADYNISEILARERSRAAVLFIEQAIAAGLVSLLIFWVAGRIAANAERLRDQLDRYRRGATATPIQVPGEDEIGAIATVAESMRQRINQQIADLERTMDVTIEALVSLAEARDNETGQHIKRTQIYVRLLAEELADKPGYAEALTPARIEMFFKSAPLHDMGKVGIPDAILLKPGKLDDGEFTVMKTHAEIGGEALLKAQAQFESSPFLRIAAEIAYSHHEKWDGSGYPKRLAGTAIPLAGRLMALADVYDALRSARVYKPPFSHDKAKGIILEGKGAHFDPAVVEAFLAREADFVATADRLADPVEEAEAEERQAETEPKPRDARG